MTISSDEAGAMLREVDGIVAEVERARLHRTVRFAIGAASEIRQCRRVSPLERRSRLRCFDF